MLETIDGVLSIIEHLIAIFSALWLISGFLFGFFKLLTRFGMVHSRKISIVADRESFESLSKDLTDTEIFRERNVKRIDSNHLSEVRESKLLLVDYRYVTDAQITDILRDKNPKCGLIIYAPPPLRLPNDLMETVVNHPYTLLVNFRGRLVNDVLSAMMTTPR